MTSPRPRAVPWRVPIPRPSHSGSSNFASPPNSPPPLLSPVESRVHVFQASTPPDHKHSWSGDEGPVPTPGEFREQAGSIGLGDASNSHSLRAGLLPRADPHRRRGRRCCLIVFAWLVLLGAAAVGVYFLVRYEQCQNASTGSTKWFRFQGSEVNRIEISVTKGRVRVMPSLLDVVELQVNSVSYSTDNIRDHLPSVEHKDTTVTLKSDLEDNFLVCVELEVVLTVGPNNPNLVVNVNTKGGEVHVTNGLLKELAVFTSSGDVTVRNTRCPALDLNTVSGNIDAGIQGATQFTAQSTRGNVHLFVEEQVTTVFNGTFSLVSPSKSPQAAGRRIHVTHTTASQVDGFVGDASRKHAITCMSQSGQCTLHDRTVIGLKQALSRATAPRRAEGVGSAGRGEERAPAATALRGRGGVEGGR